MVHVSRNACVAVYDYFLFEIEIFRAWLIKILNLPIILTREIQYADAILALGNLIKNNKKLRQIKKWNRNLCRQRMKTFAEYMLGQLGYLLPTGSYIFVFNLNSLACLCNTTTEYILDVHEVMPHLI